MKKNHVLQSRNVAIKSIFCLLAVLYCLICLFSPPVDGAEIKLDDFSHSRVGVLTGSLQENIARKQWPEADILLYNSLSDVRAALSNQKIDCTVEPFFDLKAFKKQDPSITALDDQLAPIAIASAFPKDRNQELLQQFNAYIAQAKKDGTIAALEANWYSNDPDFEPEVKKWELSGKNGTLTVATDGDIEPFTCVINGQLTGFEIDLVSSFCEAYDYNVEWMQMPFASIIMSISTGVCDFSASGLAVTEERKESVNFSDNYSQSYNLVFYRDPDYTEGDIFTSAWSSIKESFRRTFVRENRWQMILRGLAITITITLAAALLGTLLAAGIVALRRTGKPLLIRLCNGYIRLFQGTPILVVLLICYYVIFVKTPIPDIGVAVIAFSLNSAAFISEGLRAALDGVDPGQREAALAIGFSERETFFRFILPQAIVRFLPVYSGELITLLKGTSIVGYIAIQDLTKVGDIIRSRTYEALFPLISIAVIYFLLSWGMSALLKILEKSLLKQPGSKN